MYIYPDDECKQWSSLLFLGYSVGQTRVFTQSLSSEKGKKKKWNEKIMLPLPSNAL
jgi:hypothetical protein